jgi:hypothetical protein
VEGAVNFVVLDRGLVIILRGKGEGGACLLAEGEDLLDAEGGAEGLVFAVAVGISMLSVGLR